ncbi:MAG: hypothetical protein STSR0004_07880 [Peptococcaceae bacterium]
MFNLTNNSPILLKFILIYKIYVISGCGLFVILLLGTVFGLKKKKIRKKRDKQLVDPGNLRFLQKMYCSDNDQDAIVISSEILLQVNKLVHLGEEIRDLLKQIEKNQIHLLAKKTEQPFLTLEERIYQVYKKGLGVAELAAEFGRSKGEVELILNLYKSKLKEGGRL